MTRRQLATLALRTALQLRSNLRVTASHPVCIFDVAETLGVDVRFVDLPSMEGMYHRSSAPTILVSSLRPPGRQAFTCAHELGHHVFEHASHIDELVANSGMTSADPDEALADLFAGFLLMPKLAIESAFRTLGVDPARATAESILTISNWFGVGYKTLLLHASRSLGIVPTPVADLLSKVPLSATRGAITETDGSVDLVVVTQHWIGRPVDVAMDQLIVAPQSFQFPPDTVVQVGKVQERSIFKPTHPGVSQVVDSSSPWSSFLRISRAGFVGRAAFRHLEDPEYEERP